MKKKMYILLVIVLICAVLPMHGMTSRATLAGSRLSQQTVRQLPKQQTWGQWFRSWRSGSTYPRQQGTFAPAVTQTQTWGQWLRSLWSGSAQPKVSTSVSVEKPSPFSPWGQQRGFSTSVVQKDDKLHELLRKMQNVGEPTQEEQLADLKNRINNQYAQLVSLIFENKLPSIEQVEKFAELVKKSGSSIAADINKRYQNGNSLFRHLLYLTAQNKGNPKIINVFYELGGRCTKEDYEIIINSLPNLKWFKETVNELGNKNYDDFKLSEVVKIADRLHSISRLLRDLGFPKDMYSTGKFNLWPLVELPSRSLIGYQSWPTQFYEKELKNRTIGNLRRRETTGGIIYPGGRIESKDILKIFQEAGFVKESPEQALLATSTEEVESIPVDKAIALPLSSFNDMYNILYKDGVYQGPEDLYRAFMQKYAPDKLKSRFEAGEISEKDFADMQEKVAALNGARSARYDE